MKVNQSRSTDFLKGTLQTVCRGLLALLTIAVLLGFMPSISQAAEYKLEDFMILVDDQLIIRGAADVNAYTGAGRRTDLGSRYFAEIGGKARCRIPVGAPTVADVAVIAPNVRLGNFAAVSHIIYDAATGSYSDVATAGRIGPDLLESDMGNNSLNDTGFKDLPAFPAFPGAIVPGLVDVVIPSGGSQVVPPGAYRDLLVGFKGKVYLQSGVYTFRRIIFYPSGEYNVFFENNTEVRVKEFVTFSEYGNVNPTMATDVILYVEGADGSYGGDNKNPDGVYGEPAAFYYAGDGHFCLCFVYVPNGTIGLRGKSQPPHVTQWFGLSFLEVSTLRISLNQSTETCYIRPGIECACITDFVLNLDGTLQVKGVNFSEETVERLAIFTPNAPLVAGGVTSGNTASDQLQANLTFVSLDRFDTQNSVVAALNAAGYVSGDEFLLGIIYPIDLKTGNIGGYCIFTDKTLVLP